MDYFRLRSSCLWHVSVFPSGQIMEFSAGSSTVISAKKGKFVVLLLHCKASWSQRCIQQYVCISQRWKTAIKSAFLTSSWILNLCKYKNCNELLYLCNWHQNKRNVTSSRKTAIFCLCKAAVFLYWLYSLL